MIRSITIGALLLMIVSIPIWVTQSQTQNSGCLVGNADPRWRFGITVPYGTAGYDLAALNAGGFLDWSPNSNPFLPGGMDHVRVLRVSDAAYPTTLASLSGWVASYPGAVWLIGNEPDRYGDQDSVTPEVYAERYYQLASLIRSLDSAAKLGFGTVVQPTPIRMRYLKKAYDRLQQLAYPGDVSGLIDIWSVHGFILNELGSWGAGIPVGFENDYGDAIIITNFADTYSFSIFTQRIIAFRVWMNQIGQREKPLWITEYGSLFPPIDPVGTDYINVSDQDTAAYMVATFEVLLNARDSATGLAADGNRLVQRWFWYSLNEHRYVFGGSLYDQDQSKAITPVGQAFVNYTSRLPVCYWYLPQVLR